MNSDRNRLRSLVETTDDLPAMPQIWMRVRKITEDLHASAYDVAEVILKDQAMTARILKAANSAVYAGYHQKITTITNAIVLLGFKEVRNIVLGYAAFHMLNRLKRSNHFDFKSFWVHSLATAVAARMISESVSYELPEEAFVAGLLHDIGKLIAAYLLPDAYGEVLTRLDRKGNTLKLEREILGADHQEIGQWAAQRWVFPDVLKRCIGAHHRAKLKAREKSKHVLVDIVAVANDMAKIIFRTAVNYDQIDPREAQVQAQATIGIPKERWATILRQLATNVRKFIDEFNLKQEDLEAYTEYLEESNQEHIRTERFYEELNRELTEKVKELNTLNQFSTALLQTVDTDEIIHLLIESIYRAVNFSRVILLTPQRRKLELVVREGIGADVEHLLQVATLDLRQKGAIASSFREGKIINILNAASHLYADQVSKQELELLKCASFACVPLIVNSEARGVIVVDNHIPAEPVPDHRLNAVVTFVNQASLALQRAVV
ncbi:MAG: HDOD domain-containing protein [candidate division KSB1 bacterium]|nr:HDOD domain-containing protein [candidate division KSB1 bacterium]MDQ7065927.1 HDOD domain-containing protein [candidate division KSB1 bacterium]